MCIILLCVLGCAIFRAMSSAPIEDGATVAQTNRRSFEPFRPCRCLEL